VAAANTAGGRDNVTVVVARAGGEVAAPGSTVHAAATRESAPPAGHRWIAAVITGLVAFVTGAAAMYFASTAFSRPDATTAPASAASSSLPLPASPSVDRDGASALAREIQRDVESWQATFPSGAGNDPELRLPQPVYEKTVSQLDRLVRVLGPATENPETSLPVPSTDTPDGASTGSDERPETRRE